MIRKEASKNKDHISIIFNADDKNDFYDLLGKVKTLDGRKFQPDIKRWYAPLSRRNVSKLFEWGFDLDAELLSFHQEGAAPKKEIDITIDIDLYPFQEQGIKFILEKEGRALIADEMGLGKTVQALGWLKVTSIRPALIVCPASLKINWSRECKKWGLEQPYIVTGRNNSAAYKKQNIVIINYDILEAHLDSLQAIDFQALILDECHYIKNPGAKRTKAMKELGKGIPNIVALSGTPITNRPIEFFSTLNLLRPDIFQGRFQFAMKYCGAHHNGFGWDFNGASNIPELNATLTEEVMIRRLKKDVLKELPQKQRSVIPVAIHNRSEYEKAESDLIVWIEGESGKEAAERASRAEHLARFEKLKQLAVRGKMHLVYEWIESFLDQGEKLVVFATHHETIDALMNKFPSISVKLDGRDSAENRQKSVDLFQEDKTVKLFIGNIKAAGVGITLTASSNVAFIELDWVPGNHDQAEDRVHRIGQEAESINAWYLIAQGTIEDELVDILDRKRQVLSATLDGVDAEGESLLRELMSRYKK